MPRSFCLVAALLASAPLADAKDNPKPLVEGLKTPESVAVGPDGTTYMSEMGEFGKDGDGRIVIVKNGKIVPFVEGLDDPKGIVVYSKWLFVADITKVYRIDLMTKKQELFVPANAFPTPPLFLNDITADAESGILYVSDSGDLKGHAGAVYRITPQGLVDLVVNDKTLPGLNTPNGVLNDGASHLLLADFGTGDLYRIKLANRTYEKIAAGLGSPDGLAWDNFGRLFISDYKGGKVYVIPRPGQNPILMAEGFKAAADLCMTLDKKQVLVPDMNAGTLVAIKAEVPGEELDQTPFPAKLELAFTDLKWTGYKPETDSGKVNQFRPILLTNAGDGSNRIFVPSQQGVIHSFKNDQAEQATSIFIDLTDRVKYNDATNEEGFLGLAFHPKFKETGEFYVFYTPKGEKMRNIVSRFKVMKDDPTKGDPKSEQILITYERPFWNHDGGTICFGPDGYLYIVHGDGGAANDLYDNGQKLSSLLGKVLRIDINDEPKGVSPRVAYAIPKDNPFIGVKDARPEIYAFGLRNPWRMAFDRKTGKLWAGDVGQNLYEEIDIIVKGGNYGWNRREGLHPFGALGTGPRKGLIDPIWEYHHDIGKSITGGSVYRGSRVPELNGHYIYGDYVSSRVWALKYDETKGRVVANRPIKDPNKPVYSFGEDEQGELYMLTASGNGKGIYRFAK